MTELQILTAVQNNGGSIEFSTLLNLGQTDSPWMPKTDEDLIKALIAQTVLSGKAEPNTSITFGNQGRLRLRNLQQAAQDQADQIAEEARKENKKLRHEWNLVFVTAGLSALATVLAQIILAFIFN